MIIKDKYGTKIHIKQARNGRIIIPIGDICIYLEKKEAEKFTLHDIEDFDMDKYLLAYAG